MKTSLAGAMEIIGHEAIVLTPYRDSKGILTIGIGHTAAAGSPNPSQFVGKMSVKQAIDLFRRDLAKYEARVNAAFTVSLRQHEFDAAVSFDFNTGGIHKATWVKSFNAGKRDLAIDQIMNWCKPPEIEGRRKKEQSLFRSGLYTGGGFATLYPATPGGHVERGKGKRIDLAKAYGSTQPATDAQQPSPPPTPVPKPVPAPRATPAPAKPRLAFLAAALVAGIAATLKFLGVI